MKFSLISGEFEMLKFHVVFHLFSYCFKQQQQQRKTKQIPFYSDIPNKIICIHMGQPYNSQLLI